MERITYDDFKKVEIKIGEIVSVEKVEGTDKLLKLMVDIKETNEDGTPKLRQIVSGIALKVEDPQSLVGKKFPFVTNLEFRTIRGVESQGMIVAVNDNEGRFSFIEPTSPINNGSVIS